MKGKGVYSFSVPTELATRGGHLIERGTTPATGILVPAGEKLVKELMTRIPELDYLAIVTPKRGVSIVTPISGQQIGNSRAILDKIPGAFEAALGPDFAVSAEQQLATVS